VKQRLGVGTSLRRAERSFILIEPCVIRNQKQADAYRYEGSGRQKSFHTNRGRMFEVIKSDSIDPVAVAIGAGVCQFQTVDEIAAERKLSRNTVIRIFEDEPGVEIRHFQKRLKRRYRTIRIPIYVKNRVFARMTNQ
jgi:hypothetical protein